MTNNLVPFKKKLTIEQRDIDLIKGQLNNLLKDLNLLTNPFTKPYLGNAIDRENFDILLEGTLLAAVQWLLEDLGDGSHEQTQAAYEAYEGLINWYKSVETPGECYAVTLYANQNQEVMQYIFMNTAEHDLALVGVWDDKKDVVTSVVQMLNGRGMTFLGFPTPDDLS